MFNKNTVYKFINTIVYKLPRIYVIWILESIRNRRSLTTSFLRKNISLYCAMIISIFKTKRNLKREFHDVLKIFYKNPLKDVSHQPIEDGQKNVKLKFFPKDWDNN